MTALTWPYPNLPWRRLVHQAAVWWLSELAGLLPTSLRRRWAARSATNLRLDFSREGASLFIQARDRSVPTIVPVALAADARTPSDWSRLANLPVQVRLDESFLFRPVVELPLAAERSLGSILHHQLERLVPLDPGTLRFVWHITERESAKNRLKVQLCIVKQATLERATALVRELGLTPHSVVVGGSGHPPATIWRAVTAPGTTPKQRAVLRGLELTAACCAVGAYVLLVWHLEARRSVLRDQISELRLRSQTVQALSRRAATAEATLAEVNSRLAAPSTLAVLDALTRTIPLDGWVSELHLQDGKAEISGVASHATKLLAAIEREALFQSPSFLAPIVAGGPDTGERYQLGFQVNGSSAP